MAPDTLVCTLLQVAPHGVIIKSATKVSYGSVKLHRFIVVPAVMVSVLKLLNKSVQLTSVVLIATTS